MDGAAAEIVERASAMMRHTESRGGGRPPDRQLRSGGVACPAAPANPGHQRFLPCRRDNPARLRRDAIEHKLTAPLGHCSATRSLTTSEIVAVPADARRRCVGLGAGAACRFRHLDRGTRSSGRVAQHPFSLRLRERGPAALSAGATRAAAAETTGRVPGNRIGPATLATAVDEVDCALPAQGLRQSRVTEGTRARTRLSYPPIAPWRWLTPPESALVRIRVVGGLARSAGGQVRRRHDNTTRLRPLTQPKEANDHHQRRLRLLRGRRRRRA